MSEYPSPRPVELAASGGPEQIDPQMIADASRVGFFVASWVENCTDPDQLVAEIVTAIDFKRNNLSNEEDEFQEAILRTPLVDNDEELSQDAMMQKLQSEIIRLSKIKEDNQTAILKALHTLRAIRALFVKSNWPSHSLDLAVSMIIPPSPDVEHADKTADIGQENPPRLTA